MDKPAFTPGPWEIDGILMIGGIPQSADVYRDFGLDDEATLDAEPICQNVAIADARLIAAAPELYEALTWTLAEIEGRTAYQDAHQRARCLARVQAVIAKAEGRA